MNQFCSQVTGTWAMKCEFEVLLSMSFLSFPVFVFSVFTVFMCSTLLCASGLLSVTSTSPEFEP